MQLIFSSYLYAQEQQVKVTNENLAQIATQEAEEAEELGKIFFLDKEQINAIQRISFNHAVELRDLIVDSSTEVDMITATSQMEEEKNAAIQKVLDPQKQQLYSYINTKEYEKAASFYGNMSDNYGADPKLKEELTTYIANNILPFLLKHKIALDEKISNEDKQALADYNEDFVALVTEIAEEQIASGNPKTPSKLALLKLRRQNKELIDGLKEIRKTYQTELDEISVALTPQEEKWHKDMEAIGSQYISENEGKELKKRARKLESIGARYALSQFSLLLLDPANPSQFFEITDKIYQMRITADTEEE